jgi:hypothetical protein
MPSAAEYWEQRATELSRTSLETIRASATAWAATTTALLGVFGTVAIVKGPESISALDGTSRDVVTGLVIGAAVVAFASVLATSYASRGPTKRYTPLTGLRLATWTRRTARSARTALLVGQATGVAAALLVLAAGVTAAVSGTGGGSAPAAQSFLIRTSDGALQCGVLKRSGRNLVLAGSSGATLLDLSSGVAAVTTVSSCPDGTAKSSSSVQRVKGG